MKKHLGRISLLFFAINSFCFLSHSHGSESSENLTKEQAKILEEYQQEMAELYDSLSTAEKIKVRKEIEIMAQMKQLEAQHEETTKKIRTAYLTVNGRACQDCFKKQKESGELYDQLLKERWDDILNHPVSTSSDISQNDMIQEDINFSDAISQYNKDSSSDNKQKVYETALALGSKKDPSLLQKLYQISLTREIVSRLEKDLFDCNLAKRVMETTFPEKEYTLENYNPINNTGNVIIKNDPKNKQAVPFNPEKFYIKEVEGKKVAVKKAGIIPTEHLNQVTLEVAPTSLY